eukprot:scaffold36028_cov15-Tisochrysis_lutea.AAC.1
MTKSKKCIPHASKHALCTLVPGSISWLQSARAGALLSASALPSSVTARLQHICQVTASTCLVVLCWQLPSPGMPD